MKNNSLIVYLEKKYGRDSRKILDKYADQKAKYVEQGKK
jgi:hypothetical protein